MLAPYTLSYLFPPECRSSKNPRKISNLLNSPCLWGSLPILPWALYSQTPGSKVRFRLDEISKLIWFDVTAVPDAGNGRGSRIVFLDSPQGSGTPIPTPGRDDSPTGG